MSEPIIVVSGIPRSGTSLMMAMLEAGGIELLTDGVRGSDESNPRGYFELEAVKRTQQDASWLARAEGRAVKVIHRLLPQLPRERCYRVILLERASAEVVASQARMLERLGEPAGDLADARLARIYDVQLQETRALLSRHACFDWIAVAHRRMIEQPHAVAAEVALHLGITAERVSAMAARVEPALHRSRS